MSSLHVRTEQDCITSVIKPDNEPTEVDIGPREDVNFVYSEKNDSGSISSQTMAFCISRTPTGSPSLALRPTVSVDSSSSYDDNDNNTNTAIEKSTNDTSAAGVDLGDDQSAALEEPTPATPPHSSKTSRELTSERKKWIEQTLLNKNRSSNYITSNAREEHPKQTQNSDFASERRRWFEQALLDTTYKPYSTNARDEIWKNQNKNELTSERKRWIESTLLSANGSTDCAQRNDGQDLLELRQVSSSVAERRQWLSEVTNVKSVAELEEEVRQEAKMKEEERKKAEEEAARMAKVQEEERKKAEEEAAKKKIDEAKRLADEEASRIKADEAKRLEEEIAMAKEAAAEEAMAAVQETQKEDQNYAELVMITPKKDITRQSDNSDEIIAEKQDDTTPNTSQPLNNDASLNMSPVATKRSINEEVTTNTPQQGKRKKKKLLLKGLVKKFTPKKKEGRK